MKATAKNSLAAAIAFATLSMTASAAEQPHSMDAALAEQWTLFDDYCMKCHNYDDFSGGLALEDYGPDDVTENPAVFEEVLRKLKISAMPPRGQKQPSPQARARFVATLENTLDAAAAANPYAGTTTVHRLNRAEYTNAIRDLLGVEMDLTELLPSDGGDFGFDNIGDVLTVSPMLLEKYLDAAQTIVTTIMPPGPTEIAERSVAGRRFAVVESKKTVPLTATAKLAPLPAQTVAATEGASGAFSIAANTTAWDAGEYRFEVREVLAGLTSIVARQRLRVLPSASSIAPGTDVRSDAAKAVCRVLPADVG